MRSRGRTPKPSARAAALVTMPAASLVGCKRPEAQGDDKATAQAEVAWAVQAGV